MPIRKFISVILVEGSTFCDFVPPCLIMPKFGLTCRSTELSAGIEIPKGKILFPFFALNVALMESK